LTRTFIVFIFGVLLIDKGKVMKVMSQKMMPDYVLLTMEDGTEVKTPYLVNENGEEYIEIFPNDPETHLINSKDKVTGQIH